MTQNPFKNHNVRTLYDKKNKKYWFCAVDIITMLTGSPYKKAQTYWSTYKYRTPYFNPSNGYINTKLTLPHLTNGKFYLMDVIDLQAINHIIKTIPHKNAKFFKKIADILGSKRIERRMNQLARQGAVFVLDRIKTSNQVVRCVTTRVVERFIEGQLKASS